MTNATKAAEAMREAAAMVAERAAAQCVYGDYMEIPEDREHNAVLAVLHRRVRDQIHALPLPAETPDQGEALRTARVFVERARLNLSFAKQDAVETAAEAESNRNSAYHDCVSALAAIDAATPAPDERRSAAEIRAEIERLRAELSRPGLWDRILVEEHIAALEWTLAPPKPPAVKET